MITRHMKTHIKYETQNHGGSRKNAKDRKVIRLPNIAEGTQFQNNNNNDLVFNHNDMKIKQDLDGSDSGILSEIKIEF